MGICGVSDRELHDNLDAELHEFAEARGVSYDKLCDDLRSEEHTSELQSQR